MGYIVSADTVFGWRGHFDRISRLFDSLAPEFDDEGFVTALDRYLVFFVFCSMLRDWMVEEGVFKSHSIDAEIRASKPMLLCRDIANRVKHRRIDKNPFDPNWSVGREYFGPSRHRMFLLADAKYDLFEVADACMQFWKRKSASLTG